MVLKSNWEPGDSGLSDWMNEAAQDVNGLASLTSSGRLSETALNTAIADQIAQADVGSNVRLDALAAGQRLRATLAGNESEPAAATLGAITAVTATSVVSIGTATFTDTGDVITTSADHGLATGDAVSFGTITATTGVTAGDVYFVRDVLSATTFTVSSSPGGGIRTLTTDGSTVAVYRRERAYLRQSSTVNPAFRGHRDTRGPIERELSPLGVHHRRPVDHHLRPRHIDVHRNADRSGVRGHRDRVAVPQHGGTPRLHLHRRATPGRV